VEVAGYEYGVRWGANHVTEFNHHLSYSALIETVPEFLEGKTLFTTVRNPYKRIISFVYCPYVHLILNECTLNTVEEFNERINRYANYFLEIGLKRGDDAVVFLENRSQYMFIIVA